MGHQYTQIVVDPLNPLRQPFFSFIHPNDGLFHVILYAPEPLVKSAVDALYDLQPGIDVAKEILKARQPQLYAGFVAIGGFRLA